MLRDVKGNEVDLVEYAEVGGDVLAMDDATLEPVDLEE